MLRRRVAVAALVGLLAALGLGACGGDEPREKAATPAATRTSKAAVKLVEQASGPNAAASSGVIDGSVELSLQGAPGFEKAFSASVSGPFTYREGSALPDYALEIGARDYGAELRSVGGRSYVSIGSTGYAVPDAIRRRLVRSSARGKNGLTRTLEQFGIAPWRWETEQRLAGTERIDGVEVQRVSTSFNAGRMLRDANTLLGLLTSLGITRATGLPAQISSRARRVFVRGVTTKVGASWIGVEDKVLRRSGFTMVFAIPRADRAKLGGLSGGRVVGRLSVTGVGKPRRIAAPSPLGSFADFELALDALGDARDRGG